MIQTADAAPPLPLDLPPLTQLGNVPRAYRHHDRRTEPGPPLVLPHAILKWYRLSRQEERVPDDLDDAARAHLATEAAAGRLELGHGLGFALLHASDPFAYLFAAAWYQTQELWLTLAVLERTGGGGDGWRRVHPGDDWSTICVWELAPAWHERQAWVRYLRSPRDEAAKRAYLGDQLAGLA